MNGDRNGFAKNTRTTSITPAVVICASLICFFAGFNLAGCTGSEKSNFYMLDPLVRFSPAEPDADGVDISIGIGPVTIPEYLNRPQIVTRSSQYEIEIGEFDRWAETLEASVPRVLGENLSALLSTNRVYIFPWPKKNPEYQLLIDIIQFDGKLPGNVELTARWTLLKDGLETRIYRKRFSDKKPIAAQGYSGMVSAMSLVLYDLSREIADSVLAEELDNSAASSM